MVRERWRRIPVVKLGWTPNREVFEKEDKFVVRTELLEEIGTLLEGS